MNPMMQAFLGLLLCAAPATALASALPIRGNLNRWCLGAALGPVGLGASALALRLAGMGSAGAGWGALGFWLVAALAMAMARGVPVAPRGAEARALGLVLGISLLVLLPPLANGFLRVRSDAWFHAAVEMQVRNLPLPPQDPYYAGLPLQYFWFFHQVLAVFDSVAGIRAFDAMWLFNSIYFALTLLGARQLCLEVRAGEAAARWAPWLVAAGANPFGWLWLIAHGLRDPGGWRGLGPHLPDYVLNLVSWGYSSAALGFSMDKFLVGTAFSWGLALFLWWAVVAARFMETGERSAAMVAGLLTGAAALVHTVAGFSAAWAGALGTVLTLALAPSRMTFSRAALLGAAMAGGLLLVYPYLHGVTQGKIDGGLPQWGLNRGMVWTTLWVGAGLLPFALVSLRERWTAGPGGRWLILTCMGMLAVSCLMRLVFGNEGKFLHLSLLLLAALAAPGAHALLHRWFRSGTARVAALSLVFAPTTALVLGCVLISRGHASERPAPPEPGADENRLYTWLRRETDPGSALLVRPPSLEALVRAGRAQVWSKSNYAVNWGYAPGLIEARRRATVDAFESGLTPVDLVFLKTLQRPIYRISREGSAPPLPGLVPAHREGEWVAERLTFSEAR